MKARKPKQYGFNGIEGCVVQRKARETGTLVGVYHGFQSGMESDPETPWVTVCEVHGSIVGHSSLRLAMGWAADPEQWCEECRNPPTFAVLVTDGEGNTSIHFNHTVKP
jgi:hypothetical protein